MKARGSYENYNPATEQSDWSNTRSYAIIKLIPYFNVSDQSDCSKRGDLFHLLHLPVHLLLPSALARGK